MRLKPFASPNVRFVHCTNNRDTSLQNLYTMTLKIIILYFAFLQVVDVPMIDNRECERWHRDKGINVVIYDEMVCAGYYGGGKDSCQVNHIYQGLFFIIQKL